MSFPNSIIDSYNWLHVYPFDNGDAVTDQVGAFDLTATGTGGIGVAGINGDGISTDTTDYMSTTSAVVDTSGSWMVALQFKQTPAQTLTVLDLQDTSGDTVFRLELEGGANPDLKGYTTLSSVETEITSNLLFDIDSTEWITALVTYDSAAAVEWAVNTRFKDNDGNVGGQATANANAMESGAVTLMKLGGASASAVLIDEVYFANEVPTTAPLRSTLCTNLHNNGRGSGWDYDPATSWADNLAAFDGDLVGAYNLEETTGAVLDSGPDGNNGTISNTVTRGVTGVIGNGFEFTGAGFLTLDNPTPITAFTVAGWFKVTGSPSGQDDLLFGYRDGTAAPNYIQVLYKQTGLVGINIDGSGSDAAFNSSSSLTTGSFVHIAFIGDGSTCTLYFDAVSVGSASYSGSVTGNSWSFGGFTDNSFLYTGFADMPYIWTTDITGSALTDLVNEGVGLEYPAVPRTTYSHTSPFIEGTTATTYPHTSPFVNGTTVTTYPHTSPFIDAEGVLKTYIHTSPFIAGSGLTTYVHTSPFVEGEKVTAYSHASIQVRGDGTQSYFFDLRDAAGVQEGINTGMPPTLVFTDVFTSIADGEHTIYARSVQKFKNLEDDINKTFVRFRLTSGLLDPFFPNNPLSLQSFVIAGGFVRLTWNYNPNNEEISPDTFEVYVDGIPADSVAYSAGTVSYSTTLGPLTETLKTFKVTSKANTEETVGLTVTATPSATPPDTPPFTFQLGDS